MTWVVVLAASIAGVALGMMLCAILAMSSHESLLPRAATARGCRTFASRRHRSRHTRTVRAYDRHPPR
jgi:hypothetical protein